MRPGNRSFIKPGYKNVFYLVEKQLYNKAAAKWFEINNKSLTNNITLNGKISNKLGQDRFVYFMKAKNKRKSRMTEYMNNSLASKILTFINGVKRRNNSQLSRNRLRNILSKNPNKKVVNKMRIAITPVMYNNLRKNIVLTSSGGYVKPTTTRNVGVQVNPSNINTYARAQEKRRVVVPKGFI